MINIKEDERLFKLNHSCAHLLAQAIQHLYPNAKFWVGPAIEEGFYYDIDLGDEVIKEEDLEKIEKEMKKCAKDAKNIVRHELTKEEAFDFEPPTSNTNTSSWLTTGTVSVCSGGTTVSFFVVSTTAGLFLLSFSSSSSSEHEVATVAVAIIETMVANAVRRKSFFIR